jgi:hypothetical protein
LLGFVKTKRQLAFISYRRQDSSAASRWLGETLQAAFGASKVFVDTDAIRVGDDWPQRIDAALRAATVVIAVIGPNWLRLADEHGRRRLDKRDDWVRNEIVHALRNDLLLVPLLVAGAHVPTRESLPRCLVPILKHQALELRDDRWASDRDLLLAKLEEAGFRRPALDHLPSATWANRDALVFSRQLDTLKTALALTYRARNAARSLKESPGRDTGGGRRGTLAALGSYHQAMEDLLFEDRALLTEPIFRGLHGLKHNLFRFASLIEDWRRREAKRHPSIASNVADNVATAYECLDRGYGALVIAVQSHLGVAAEQSLAPDTHKNACG